MGCGDGRGRHEGGAAAHTRRRLRPPRGHVISRRGSQTDTHETGTIVAETVRLSLRDCVRSRVCVVCRSIERAEALSSVECPHSRLCRSRLALTSQYTVYPSL